ncbi:MULTISPECIES: polynucleotide adenylyltransferase [unclassified Halomonas]|uniref:polynucleotide adenylyltransferase n=1 Tax=unclassified Halomonas TaxID=2609666 RepID=UPI0007D935A0|nr:MULTISPECIES: polynucleotide adenylyltransferase [unclassified Halomonas]MBT2785114.1 polynucleotide adenylyltransferase [Halomonas sp. ISL-106]MBT2796808.1 polynucleotide adenylyltransferase [Halomonas sp. ISL-104]OAL60034.1 polynucleotide adenylyltransferase [Halomonas sp. ALS9]
MEKKVTQQGADSRLAGLNVYRVGGAVRDALLGWPVYDNDWVVVGATPDAMRKRGFKPVGRDFPVFLHPDTAEEYALARTERKSGHGYAGFEVHASPDVSLEEDLLRRDLTINAIAQSPEGELTDPFNGQGDIERRVLRHISAAFSEDPLRVLRTARFLARYASLGFTIAPETLALMRQVSQSGELEHLAAERVWVETEKALGEPSPAIYFTTLERCDALSVWWPELLGGSLEEGLEALAQTPSSSAPALAHWRYAQLVSPLNAEQRDVLAQRLKLPNAVAQLARHTALTHALLAVGLEGSKVLHWLERLDGWRKPEQVEAQLALVKVLAPDQLGQLESAWQAALKVSPRVLIAEGYQGAALGEALRERRGQAVTTALAD